MGIMVTIYQYNWHLCGNIPKAVVSFRREIHSFNRVQYNGFLKILKSKFSTLNANAASAQILNIIKSYMYIKCLLTSIHIKEVMFEVK